MGRPPLGKRRKSDAVYAKRYRAKKKRAQALTNRTTRLVKMQAKADRESAEVAASNAAFAESLYGHKRWACGIVDVPLDFNTRSDKGRSRAPKYNLLSATAIAKIKAPFARDAGMYFWAWSHQTEECMFIMKEWGFRKARSLYWVKTLPDGSQGYMTTGYYAMADPVEELWICRRGDYVAPMMGDGFEHIAWLLPATDEHSEKPPEFYDAIVRLHHPQVELLEMFATKRRPLWWAYGDAIEGMIQPPLDGE